MQFCELDYPATSAARAGGIVGEGAPDNFTQIAADFGGATPTRRTARSGTRWRNALLLLGFSCLQRAARFPLSHSLAAV